MHYVYVGVGMDPCGGSRPAEHGAKRGKQIEHVCGPAVGRQQRGLQQALRSYAVSMHPDAVSSECGLIQFYAIVSIV
jgi:hypothetical protein